MIPLIPAMRPCISKRSALAAPIITPPMDAYTQFDMLRALCIANATARHPRTSTNVTEPRRNETLARCERVSPCFTGRRSCS